MFKSISSPAALYHLTTGRLKERRNRFFVCVALTCVTLIFLVYDVDWDSIVVSNSVQKKFAKLPASRSTKKSYQTDSGREDNKIFIHQNFGTDSDNELDIKSNKISNSDQHQGHESDPLSNQESTWHSTDSDNFERHVRDSMKRLDLLSVQSCLNRPELTKIHTSSSNSNLNIRKIFDFDNFRKNFTALDESDVYQVTHRKLLRSIECWFASKGSHTSISTTWASNTFRRIRKFLAAKYPVINLDDLKFRIDTDYPECSKNSPNVQHPSIQSDNSDKSDISIDSDKSDISIDSDISVDKDPLNVRSIKFDKTSSQTGGKSYLDQSWMVPINLVVIIHTAPANFRQRMAIRKTWGSLHYVKLKTSHSSEESFFNSFYNATSLNSSNNKDDELKKYFKNQLFNIFRGQMPFAELNIRLVFLTASTKLKNSVLQSEHPQMPVSPKPTTYAGSENLKVQRETTVPTQQGFNFDIYHGTYQTNRVTEKLLRIEASKYRDIIQGDFFDSYQNLTYKMIMGFKWIASRCDAADYILKMDDDVLANIYPLYVTLNKIRGLKLLYDLYLASIYNQRLKAQISTSNAKFNGFEAGLLTEPDKTEIIDRLHQEEVRENGMKSKLNWIKFYDALDREFVEDSLSRFVALSYTVSDELNIHKTAQNCPETQNPTSDNGPDNCQTFDMVRQSLDQNPFEHVLYCNVWVGMPVLRDVNSKWYVSREQIPEDSYPPYCSGWALIAPYATAYELLYTAPKEKYFWIDDAQVTGIVARSAKISFVRLNNRFTFGDFAYNYNPVTGSTAPEKVDVIVQLQESMLNNNNNNDTLKESQTPDSLKLVSEKDFVDSCPTTKYLFGPVVTEQSEAIWQRIQNFYSPHIMAF